MSLIHSYGAEAERPEEGRADLVSRGLRASMARSATDPYILSDWRHLSAGEARPEQGATNACVVFGINRAEQLGNRAAGRPAPLRSVPWGYAVSWWIEKPQTKPDSGGRLIRSLLRAYTTYGMANDVVWPFSPETLFDPPPIEIDIAADDERLKLSDWARVDGDPCRVCEEELAQGHFPVYSMAVYENYDKYSGNLNDGFVEIDGHRVYDQPHGNLQGRHVQCVVGRGPGYFIVEGSWGNDFADDGYSYLTDAAFRDARYVGEHTFLRR